MIRRIRSLMPVTRSESGMSVIELLVTMILLGLILLMASNMYISVVRTTDSSQAVNEGTRVASNAMNEINRVVRFAVKNPVSGSVDQLPAFTVAKPNEMVIFSLVDIKLSSTPPDPSALRPVMLKPVMVKFALETDGNVFERRWDPALVGQYWQFGSWPKADSTAARSRVLGGKFLATGTNLPLFRYFKLDPTKADGTSEMAPIGTANLTQTEREQIAFVEVTMNAVPLVGPDDQPVIISNKIGLLNLRAKLDGS